MKMKKALFFALVAAPVGALTKLELIARVVYGQLSPSLSSSDLKVESLRDEGAEGVFRVRVNSGAVVCDVTEDVTPCEFRGRQMYSEYLPDVVQTPIFYDGETKMLGSTHLDLHGMEPLYTTLQHGRLQVDASRTIGTLLGRSHAASHMALDVGMQSTTPYGRKKRKLGQEERHLIFQSVFKNEDSFAYRQRYFFDELKDLVDFNDGTNISAEEVQAALLQLETSHSDRKKCKALIHGNLFPGTILLPLDEESSPKVTSFSNFALGPAGVDVGLFLSSYVFYFATHSRPGSRRALRQGVREVLDSYTSAFEVLARSTKSTSGAALTGVLLGEILLDAVGYLGLALLRLSSSSSSSGENELGFSYEQRELQWGDWMGRRASVKKRQRVMAFDCLSWYYRQHHGETTTDDVATFLDEIFRNDDIALDKGHQTEFWF